MKDKVDGAQLGSSPVTETWQQRVRRVLLGGREDDANLTPEQRRERQLWDAKEVDYCKRADPEPRW